MALRGGIILLLLPIVVLPTPVEVRLALGAHLGSTGLTAGFWAMVAIATLVSAVIAIAMLFALAWIELATYERAIAGVRPVERRRRGLLGRLFVLQALTLLALAVCALPLAAVVGQATYDELLRPSSSASIYIRVMGQVGPALIVFMVAVVAIDTLSAIATRRLLSQRHSMLSAIAGALVQPLRSPMRTLGVAFVGWTATIVALGAAWVGLGLAWRAARGTFLGVTSIFDLAQLVLPVLVALLLATVFCASLALVGVASALRSTLWSLQFKS